MMLFERDPLVTDARESSSLTGPRRTVMNVWILVVAMMHFDRGAAFVAAMGVTEWSSDQHSFGFAAALLAWHSLGMALGNSVSSAVLQQVPAKTALLCSLGLGAICSLCLALLEDPGVVSCSLLRFCGGFSAAVPLVYLPLWVDEFACTDGGTWMSVLQLGTPLGHFFGSLAAAGACVWKHSWRWALMPHAMIMISLLLKLAIWPVVQVDVVARIQTARLDCINLYGAEASGIQNLFREMREMFQGMNRNPLTLALSLTLGVFHTIAAILALWSAPYLYVSADAPKAGSVIIFLCATIFSLLPSLGCCLGIMCCERLQGFKAGMHAVALKVACCFAVLAAMCGPLNSAAEGWLLRFLLLGLWLLCAGAVLPICCALLMTSMPSYLRSFNAASLFLVWHIASFTGLPFLLSLLMGLFINAEKALNFGISLALWATTFAAIVLLFTYAREPKSSGPSSLSGVDDLTVQDVSYELARRRISTAPL